MALPPSLPVWSEVSARFTCRERGSSLCPVRNRTYRDPVVEVYKRDVDRSLLRENLKLTPAERLEKLLRFSAFAAGMRAAGDRARTPRKP